MFAWFEYLVAWFVCWLVGWNHSNNHNQWHQQHINCGTIHFVFYILIAKPWKKLHQITSGFRLCQDPLRLFICVCICKKHQQISSTIITKHFRYLKWRNPHLYKLYVRRMEWKKNHPPKIAENKVRPETRTILGTVRNCLVKSFHWQKCMSSMVIEMVPLLGGSSQLVSS